MCREQTMEQEFCIGNKQNHKTPEENKVVYAERAAYYTTLSEGIVQHVPDTFARMVEAVIGFAQEYQPEASVTAPDKNYNGNHKNDGENR